jgi:hypothetical protein
VLRHAAGVIERPAQQHLDVGVEAAKLVCGPPGEGVVDCRVDPQEDLLAFLTHV